jgi:UDP-N-acetylmuramoyl-L-alanyl-D-glutamate--2,6-diaminopimelate ligase
MSGMKLQHLFAVFPGIPDNFFTQREVTGIFSDARQVIPDSVFIAIQGTQADGHQFIPDAIAKGAIALIVERPSVVPADYPGIVLHFPRTREILDILAGRFYLYPGQELFCVGVTGTNGKTSTTYMIENIFNRAYIPTGVIGTINHHLGETVWPSAMTTPDPVALQKRLREFRDAGAQAVAMEVSSHALDQHRVDSVPFNTVIFTNLTRDHLDYHKNMDDYLRAKQRLFTDLMWRTIKRPAFAIVNIDDKYGRRLKVADPAILWTYGTKDADLSFKILKMDFSVTQFSLRTPAGETEIFLPMCGAHNVMNAVAAVGAGLTAGIPLPACALAMNLFPGVPGRLQVVPHRQNFSVFVDYAHTPDALENVLIALGRVRFSLKSQAKIWTLFGCGGDRDKGKRPLMAEIALKYSDQVMVTSDNPRTEDPQGIIQDILAGVPAAEKSRVRVQADRRQALQEVLSRAQAGDVVLIAGKGHEDYQIIGADKLPFSDYETAQKILETL